MYNSDYLVRFFYLLARDHLPVGAVNRLMRDLGDPEELSRFSDAGLESMARNWAAQVRGH